MCGIAGIIGKERPGMIQQMTDLLSHRGPDDSGLFNSADAVLDHVALGHRRLSIIDLSPAGHQPMSTEDAAYTIVFNGEIYNFRELRSGLEQKGVRFSGGSDTEVLLQLYRTHGPDCLRLLNGMFAFAIYDRDNHEVFLARDRVGIKPLYYLESKDTFAFASEGKALLKFRDVDYTINPHAIQDYLGLRYVPGHTAMFNQVRRLGPGQCVLVRKGKAEIKTWWEQPFHEGEYSGSEADYLAELEELMTRSVRRRLISDVSFGAYLSGGLDSSLIVSLMSREGIAPVKTFSVGFDYEHDELSEAKATADLLGCDHHEIACRAEDVNLLPEIVYHSDEPMGDAINIPMYQLAREAKKEVTVILTGEGADEMFAGYLFHKVMWAANLYRKSIPGPLRDWVVRPLMNLMPPSALNLAFKYPAYLGKRGKQKALDYLDVIGTGTQDEQYRHLISLFDHRDTAEIYTDDFRDQLSATPRPWTPPSDTQGSTFDQMLRLQFGHWLPDNMLMRNDKMSMASAIEGRVPFLDHEVVEFAFRVPRSLRLKGLTGKYLLRQLAEKTLPQDTAQRKKMPFYVPIEKYFQDPKFVELMNELLSEDSVRRRGIFRPRAVSQLRDAMKAKEFLFVKQVFSLMVLELWFRRFQDGES